MNKYIIEFLKQEGRVIIPDFGCLSMSDDGKVVFNTYIKFDDGKLSSYICEQTGSEPQDVINKISAWARELQAQVNTGVDYELVGLGTFYKTGPDEIDFRSGAASVASKSPVEESPKVETPSETEASPEEPQAPVVADIEPVEVQTTPEPEVPTEEEIAPKAKKTKEPKEPQIAQPTAKESKQKQNIYIPPVLGETKAKREKSTSLDDVLGKNTTEENREEVAATPVENPIEAIHETAAEPETPSAPIVETVETVTPIAEKVIVEEKANAETATNPNTEEVTVKRKRGVFFYINILLLLLIIGLSVFAYLYTDEISKWLGITTEKVIDEPEQEEEEIVAPVSEEVEEELVEEIPQEEVAPAPVEQPIIEQTPAVAASGNFHIIVGTFGVKENADRLVQKIRDAGYDGKIITSTDKGHTVSFHTYNTKEEAANQISKASEITGTSAYVLKR
jgi:hypothetical protein